MARRKKPAPLKVLPLVAYPRRGPREDGRWYWQAGYHQEGKLVSTPGLACWATKEEMTQRMAARVAARDWRVVEQAPMTAETVDHLLRLWLAAQKERRESGGLAEASYASYLHSARRLRPLLGEILLGRLGIEAIERARDHLLREELAPRTVSHALRVLRMAWTWGRERGLVAARDLPKVAVKVEAGVYEVNHGTPTYLEAERAIAELRGWHRIAGELLWATGARLGEVLTLTWADVQPTSIRLRGKTGARIVPAGDDLARWLVRPAGVSDQTQLFEISIESSRTAFRQALAAACGRASVPVFTPHGLRRLASTVLIGRGVDPKTYEALMGHSFQMGLKTYAQVQAPSVRAASGLLGRQPGEQSRGKVVRGPWGDDEGER
jgi:integrase